MGRVCGEAVKSRSQTCPQIFGRQVWHGKVVVIELDSTRGRFCPKYLLSQTERKGLLRSP